MADPFSLVAAGAALGGIASKVTEKVWESSERWLRERFGSHAAEAQEKARENAAKFVHQLAIRISGLERMHSLDQEKVSNEQRNPQFSFVLQQTIINAARTCEPEKHDLLARLVADRLTTSSETTFALASDMASDAIVRSTRRQLHLMALCCFLDEIRPRDPITSADEYREWLSVQLEPFADFAFFEVDARHLVAIACASYDPTSTRTLASLDSHRREST
ncbi:MAG: LPO_1073/Vpar_1526 family protein [Acidobacteriota bacterium]